MSVVVAVRTELGIAMAADTQVSGPVSTYGESKLWEGHPDATIGWVGIALWGQFVRGWKDEPLATQLDVERFAQAWLAWAIERGHGEKIHGTLYQEGTMLVATVEGQLWEIAGSGSVCLMEDYCAIGSGSETAAGVLWLMYSRSCPPLEVVIKAVEAAIHHASGCGGRVEHAWLLARQGGE